MEQVACHCRSVRKLAYHAATTSGHRATWLVFVFEYVARLRRATARWVFVRRAWFDLALIVLSPPVGVPDAMQGLRTLRGARAFRLLRAVSVASIGLRYLRQALGRRQFHRVVVMATTVVVLGALGAYYFEARDHGSIQSFPDALWWAIVTATTVGCGAQPSLVPHQPRVASVITSRDPELDGA
jgi:voltage-gated potassium channel